MSLWRGIGARKDAVRGTAPIEVRKTVAALFARPGVLPGGASPLMTGDATWAYNVGIANFVTSRGASDGDQLYGNDGVVLIGATGIGSTVPIAPGAGLSRIDIAWTRHQTNMENADTSSEPLFGVASGVAASSSPVAPSIPAGALEIGRNLMTDAANGTLSAGNTITQSALFTGLRGTPVPVRSAAERDAYAALVGLSDGLQVYRLDTHLTETYNGTAWIGGIGTATAYTPVLTAQTTNPTMGASTLTGSCIQIGKMAVANFSLAIGTGFVAGSGYYLLTLPSATTAPGNTPIGLIQAFNGGANKGGMAFTTDATHFVMLHSTTDALISSAGVGSAWAVGDVLAGQVTYFVA